MKNLILAAKMLGAFAMLSPDGFTIDKNTLEPITSGYCVAVADTQNSFGSDGALNVVNYASDNDNIKAFGGWFNQQNGLFYYDAVIVVNDLQTALRLGRENKQIAIFDLNRMKEITL